MKKFSKTTYGQLFICEIIAAGNYSISLKHPDTIYDTHAADPNHPLLKILPLFPIPYVYSRVITVHQANKGL